MPRIIIEIDVPEKMCFGCILFDAWEKNSTCLKFGKTNDAQRHPQCIAAEVREKP